MQSLQQIPRCVVLDGLLVLRNGSKHLSSTLRSGCLDLHFFDVLSSIDMLFYGYYRGADIRVASTAPQLASHHRQQLARKFVWTFSQSRRGHVTHSCPLLLCRLFAFDRWRNQPTLADIGQPWLISANVGRYRPTLADGLSLSLPLSRTDTLSYTRDIMSLQRYQPKSARNWPE